EMCRYSCPADTSASSAASCAVVSSRPPKNACTSRRRTGCRSRSTVATRPVSPIVCRNANNHENTNKPQPASEMPHSCPAHPLPEPDRPCHHVLSLTATLAATTPAHRAAVRRAGWLLAGRPMVTTERSDLLATAPLNKPPHIRRNRPGGQAGSAVRWLGRAWWVGDGQGLRVVHDRRPGGRTPGGDRL